MNMIKGDLIRVKSNNSNLVVGDKLFFIIIEKFNVINYCDSKKISLYG